MVLQKKSRDSLADVCGTWAAKTLLSAWADDASSKSRNSAIKVTNPESANHTVGLHKTPLYTTPDSKLEEELPSPSTFIQKKPSITAPWKSTGANRKLQKAANKDAPKPGSRAGR